MGRTTCKVALIAVAATTLIGGAIAAAVAVPKGGPNSVAAAAVSVSGVNVALLDWIENGVNDDQWYANITVGTPPQTLSVLFDTGSTQLLIPRINCTTCGNQSGKKRFDPSLSNTFSAKPGTITKPSFSTGADSIPFTVPEGARCQSVSDTVTLNGLSVKAFPLQLCDVYAQALAIMPIDGILGVGPRSAGGWFWDAYDAKQVSSPIISFDLNPGKLSGGELTLGGTDSSRYTGSLTQVATVTDQGAWEVTQQAIYIGGKPFQITTNGRATIYGASTGILDTGTAFMQPPDLATTKALYAQISSKITQIDPAGAWGAPCADLDAVAQDITFTLGATGKTQFNATIPKKFFNLGPYPNQTGICQALFNNPYESFGEDIWVSGSPLIKPYYTTWDGVNNRIGWAQRATTV